MAPKATKKDLAPSSDTPGMFDGMVVFLVENGVQKRRLQIWKQKLVQMEATIEDRLSKRVTHIFAMNSNVLFQQVGADRLMRFKGTVLLYQWLEDSLRLGDKVSEDLYNLKVESKKENELGKSLEAICSKRAEGNNPDGDKSSPCKKTRSSPVDLKVASAASMEDNRNNARDETPNAGRDSDNSYCTQDISTPTNSFQSTSDALNKDATTLQLSLPYCPPDLNGNITEIFGKLINIYRGDDRRSFSYHKAIPVIEKLPFKIVSIDQVKHLPTIGKSMQDHIHEIVTTGKLSKLEHFETDEKVFQGLFVYKYLPHHRNHASSVQYKVVSILTISSMGFAKMVKVRTITLFGEVWGIGPSTALKLYEKGHRTLDDLNNEDSLTNSQKLGLKYFDDIKTRIPRHEVQDMELLLQKAGEDVLSGVNIVCGGSFRRGKATCGDLDIVITHPDGKSHKGFLPRYVKHLKDIKFLREDLIFSIHSEEDTDSGVDTYFGLCTYPGREQRHRIDLKWVGHYLLALKAIGIKQSNHGNIKKGLRAGFEAYGGCHIDYGDATFVMLIDLKSLLLVYPRDIYAFGLIAWTGNDVLNRRLRLLAESKGYRLDDTGLFLATQSSGGKRGAKASASLNFKTEKDVFDFLGFPSLEPHERNL
ncbi:hypothetical protein HHK36_007095 [Tetracentron sinense]|uniref:DNA polymerase lambda n=1 Tax=Tetracentron sinense TaxID=13715 RepID=A0A834ZLW1_TETSI|nr:hypothetical protein HHK36_007095 [Tetracentron sinense]